MTQIPGSKEQPIDRITGQFSLPWRRWLDAVNVALNAAGRDTLSLTAAIATIATALGSPDGTVASIPDQDSLDVVIVGRNGVTVTGKAGVSPVYVELQPVEDAGTGTFKLLGRDDYGRLSGTVDGTAADVPYDNTASGLTATDVQAAIDEVAASGGAGGADLKTTARFYDEGYLPAATMGWTVDAAGSGAALAQQSVAGMNGAYTFSSGATASNRAGMLHNGFFCEVGGGEIRLYWRLQPQHTPSGSQQSQYFFGIKSGIGTTGAADYVHVQADDTTGGWLLKWVCTATGTNGASIIPGTITGGVTKIFGLEFSAGGTTVAFSINGVVIDTLTLPAGFLAMKPYLLSRKNGANGVSSNLYMDKVLAEQDR